MNNWGATEENTDNFIFPDWPRTKNNMLWFWCSLAYNRRIYYNNYGATEENTDNFIYPDWTRKKITCYDFDAL